MKKILFLVVWSIGVLVAGILQLLKEVFKPVLRVILPPACVLLVLAISTMWVQILYSLPNGQILYHNDILVVICSYIYMVATYLLLRPIMIHCIPDDAWRRRMLYALTVIIVLAVIGLPTIILLTTGDIACWDAALAVSASTVLLLYCDPRVYPSKVKDSSTSPQLSHNVF